MLLLLMHDWDGLTDYQEKCAGMPAEMSYAVIAADLFGDGVTAANIHDSQVMEDLLHVDETRVWGDSAYTGQKGKLNVHAPQAKDFTRKKGSRYHQLTELEQFANRHKSRARSRVEHVFGVMKRQFGFTKVRYRGLEKNAYSEFAKCALVNLVLAKRHLLAI